jgi:hypothetical protein
MYVVPRTPIIPRRLSPIMTPSPNSTLSYSSSQSISPPRSPSPVLDVYDKFINIYFSSDIKVQSILLKTITDYIIHPAYKHLLKTMDQDNAHHVMGYLRSQRSVEMYFILDYIIRNPLPTKQDFYQSIAKY